MKSVSSGLPLIFNSVVSNRFCSVKICCNVPASDTMTVGTNPCVICISTDCSPLLSVNAVERLSVVVLLVAEKSTEKYRSVPLPLFCDGSHQEAPPESVQSWVLSKEMYCVPPRPLNSSDVISTENISSSGGAGFSFLEHPQIIIAVSTNKNNFFIVRFI